MTDELNAYEINFDGTAKIVVGVDGSDAADQALFWAIKEAQLRKASITIVHAWEYPALVYGAYSNEGLDLEAGGKEILNKAVELGRSVDPNTMVSTVLKEGNAVPILVHEAKDADLLVVGSRGHGGFTSLVLGSVSSQLAHHSKVPLVIVHSK